MDISPQTLGPLIGAGIALVVILLRGSRPRALHVRFMWIVPLLVTLAVGAGIWFQPHAPFGPTAWLGMTAALAAGAALGWQRGRMTRLWRDGGTGQLMAQASPIGIMLVVGLLLIRNVSRGFIESHAGEWGLNAGAVTDGFLLFAAGLVVAMRIEMWLRARAISHGDPDPAQPPAAA